MTVVAGGEKCNLITYYNKDDDDDLSFGWVITLAQSFTLTAQNAIYQAVVLLDWMHGDHRLICHLHNADATGKPIGAPISVAYHSYWLRQAVIKYEWRIFKFKDFPVLPPGQYAIELIATEPAELLQFAWRNDKTAPTYTLGKAWRSLDSGASFAELDGRDFMFEIWGWEPPPDPPPTPVISNWAPLDYQHTDLITGFTIVVTTDIPCHLFMRWTDTLPLKHPLTEYRRGILIQTGTRYCFVAWEENEQIEPGDTLIHTFEKRNWPICQTRYFYFIGTKQAEEQPSASPIFQLHRTEEYQPLIYGPVIGTLSNRTIRSTWGTWPIARNGILLSFHDYHGPPYYYLRSAYHHTVSYFIHRSFLFFDTSGIPPGSVLTGAKLSIWVVDAIEESPTYPHLIVEPGHQSDPIVVNDWYNQNDETTICGKIEFDDLTFGQYNDINFTEAGLATIDPTGITKLCLLCENDFVNQMPPYLTMTGLNYHSAQKGDGFQPLLTIYYVPP